MLCKQMFDMYIANNKLTTCLVTLTFSVLLTCYDRFRLTYRQTQTEQASPPPSWLLVCQVLIYFMMVVLKKSVNDNTSIFQKS